MPRSTIDPAIRRMSISAAVMAIRRISAVKYGTRSSGMVASSLGSGPAWRPRARGKGRCTILAGAAAAWADGVVEGSPAGAVGAAGRPAGRAARAEPPGPRWGLRCCERLFFLAISSSAKASLARKWISA